MRLTLEVPLPPNELRPNGRAHWAAKARKTKKARQQGRDAAEQAHRHSLNGAGSPITMDPGFGVWKKARVRATFYVKDRRGLKQDGDNANASIKAYVDGIADYGIVENDRDFTLLPPRFEIDAANPRVVIEVEQIQEGKE